MGHRAERRRKKRAEKKASMNFRLLAESARAAIRKRNFDRHIEETQALFRPTGSQEIRVIHYLSSLIEILPKDEHGCSTGDCPHHDQKQCDAQLAADYPEEGA